MIVLQVMEESPRSLVVATNSIKSLLRFTLRLEAFSIALDYVSPYAQIALDFPTLEGLASSFTSLKYLKVKTMNFKVLPSDKHILSYFVNL